MEIKSFSPGTMQTTSSKAMWEAIRSAPKQELPAPKEYDFANPGPLKVEIIEPPEMHIEPIIDVEALGFTESETQKVETFIKDIQRNVCMIHYGGYENLGMAKSMVRYYAAHQLDAEKGQRLVDAFEEKAQSIISEDREYDLKTYGPPDNEHAIINVNNMFHYCNQNLKDTLYDLYANLDVTNESTFERSYAAAVKKSNAMILSYREDFAKLDMNIAHVLNNVTSLDDYIAGSYRDSHAPHNLNSPLYAHMNYNEQVLRYNQEQWVFYDAMKQLHSQHSGMSFIHYLGTA